MMIKKLPKLLLLIAPLLFLVFSLQNLPASVKAKDENQASDQILIQFKKGIFPQEITRNLADNKAKIIDKIDSLDVLVIKVPPLVKEKLLKALSRNPLVEYVEEDSVATAFFLPTDTFFERQWGLENTGQVIQGVAGAVDADIDGPTAWDATYGNVKVAILDTGVDQDHEDLSVKLGLQKNFTSSITVDDLYGHGTHVAGIAAAVTDNGMGVAGGCPGCVLMNGKVLDDRGSGYYSWIVNGIIWAADNGAKVINLSLGGPVKSSTLERAVNYAWKKGVVVVAAAGNSANPSKTYPAAYTNVIAVAATNNQDKKASFSSYGIKWVDVAAPGENIFSTFPNHSFVIQTSYGRSQNYDFASGTSMATPMTSAVAALIWSSPSYGTSASKVRSRLESTCEKISGTGTYWSAGRVNAAKALAN